MDIVDTILHGDALAVLKTLPSESVQTCVTSPPYWGLRDYGVPGQLGLERTPDEYVARMVEVFAEVRRVLRSDGTCWVNLGDSYANNPSTSAIPRSEQSNGTGAFRIPGEQHVQARRQKANRLTPMKRGGLKHKDLVGVPWMVAFALRADGWWLRSDIIWHKSNPMPESVRDRPTRSHEYIFLLTKRERYYYDADAIREPFAEGTDARIHQPSLDTQEGGFKTEAYQANFPGRKMRDRRPADVLRAMRDNGRTGRNKRSVWTVATAPFSGAHFAVFPPALIEPCILAGSRVGDVVLDPFMGAGTVGVVARRHSRHYLGIELNQAYIDMANERIRREVQPVLWTA